MNAPIYPEHEKLRAVCDQSQSQGEFIDWLSNKGIFLARYYGNHDAGPIHEPVTSLLAEYHDIDTRKLEAEKRAMLDEIRRANRPSP